MELNKIVKKLQKKMGNIVTLDDIGDILDPGSRGTTRDTTRIHQTVYALKGLGTIITIRNGLYYVADGVLTTGQEVVDQHYWDIVKMVANREVGKEWVIGGEKALELIMSDYAPPEELIIYTRDTAKRIVISPSHTLILRTITSGEKQSRTNVYSVLKKQSHDIAFQKNTLPVLGIEAALLDSLTIPDHDDGIGESLVLKCLKRYESRLERGNFGILVSLRYIRAMNRLREITKHHGYTRLYDICLDVIKKEGGGCFVTF